MVPWVSIVAPICVGFANLVAYSLNENSLVGRHLACVTRLLGVTNRAPGVDHSARPTRFFCWDLLDPLGPATSVFGPSWPLLLLRLVGVGYFISLFFVEEFASGDFNLNGRFMIFFTNWGFIMMGTAMLLGVLVTAVSMRGHARMASVTASAKAGGVPWSFLRKAHLLALEIAAAAALFLTAFYWATIYDATNFSKYMASGLMTHALQNVFLACDVLLSRAPFVSYHYLALLLFGTVYLVFYWVYHAVSGEWVYDSLDWTKASSFPLYIALPLLLAVAFFLYFGLATLRELLLRRCARRKEQCTPAAGDGQV